MATENHKIEKRKIRDVEYDWNTELGGPVPKMAPKPKPDEKPKPVKTD